MNHMNDLISYSVTDAAIAQMREKFLEYRVKDFDDKAGYEQCKTARLLVKAKRVEVEKRRVELKADALAFGRAVDAEAKRITNDLSQIETHLQTQQDIIDNEKKRIIEEAARKEQELIDSRLRWCQQYGAIRTISELKCMTDDQWHEFATATKTAFEEKERERAEAAEKIRRLEAQQAEQNARIAEQEAEARKLQAALLQQQAAEIAEARQREQEAERKRAIEAEEKRKAEAAAKREIADKKLFEEIKAAFPTLESAWVEIARLRKQA